MRCRIDRDRDGLARRHGARGHVSRKAQGGAIVAGAGSIAQLGRFRRHPAQFEGPVVAHENAHQARPQQDADPICQGFDDRGHVRIPMQSMRHLRQDLGPAMVFAGNLRQAARFEQAAQLSGHDGGLGSQVFVKEIGLRVMQESHRSKYLIGNHQGSGHDGFGLKLEGSRVASRVQRIHKNCAPLADRFPGHRALRGFQMKAAEALCQNTVSFGPDHFIGRKGLPEVDSAHLKKRTRLSTEQADQSGHIGALGRRRGEVQEQLLKGFVGPRVGPVDEHGISRVHS